VSTSATSEGASSKPADEDLIVGADIDRSVDEGFVKFGVDLTPLIPALCDLRENLVRLTMNQSLSRPKPRHNKRLVMALMMHQKTIILYLVVIFL